MGQIPRPLPASGPESAVPKVKTIKISEGGQATETPGPTVLKPTTEEQTMPLKLQPVECLAAPPASIKTTDEVPIEAADKTDEIKSVPPEPTVKQKKFTTKELIHHASSQESVTLQVQLETPPTEAGITKLVLKSEIVQPMIRTKNEPTQAIDSQDIMKPPTVEASLEFKETSELTSMVMYTKCYSKLIFRKPI